MDVQSNLVTFLQGKRALNLVRGELVSLVQSTLDLGRRCVRGQVSIELVVGEVPPFDFDAGRLGQALLNLLKNAAEAAGPEGSVRVEAGRVGDRARISVSDRGPGVPPAIRSRLFEPFFTTKDVGVGTGLGLAVSLEIVSQHGGRLYLDDTYGEGTRFVIELPLSGERSSREERAQLPTLIPTQQEVFV
jgi:signal transduction histidine kinase